jgi:hypothetical protein
LATASSIVERSLWHCMVLALEMACVPVLASTAEQAGSMAADARARYAYERVFIVSCP